MIYRNTEYYSDPTAGKAIENVMREEESGKERVWTWDRLDMENWADLGIAIVVRAAEEYRRARRRLAHRQNPKGAEERIRELEEFFESAWFCKLTNTDGELILERLRKETVA